MVPNSVDLDSVTPRFTPASAGLSNNVFMMKTSVEIALALYEEKFQSQLSVALKEALEDEGLEPSAKAIRYARSLARTIGKNFAVPVNEMGLITATIISVRESGDIEIVVRIPRQFVRAATIISRDGTRLEQVAVSRQGARTFVQSI